jgi:hypothetical protein
MRSHHEKRGIVLSAEELERVDTVGRIGIERMDGVLLVKVDGVGQLESMLKR